MKPSEFLKKINVDVIGDLTELDKRFIDREELLEKIDNIPRIDHGTIKEIIKEGEE